MFLEESYKKMLFVAYDAMKEDNISSTFWFPDRTKKETLFKKNSPTGVIVGKNFVIDKAMYDIETDTMSYMLKAKVKMKKTFIVEDVIQESKIKTNQGCLHIEKFSRHGIFKIYKRRCFNAFNKNNET